MSSKRLRKEEVRSFIPLGEDANVYNFSAYIFGVILLTYVDIYLYAGKHEFYLLLNL